MEFIKGVKAAIKALRKPVPVEPPKPVLPPAPPPTPPIAETPKPIPQPPAPKPLAPNRNLLASGGAVLLLTWGVYRCTHQPPIVPLNVTANLIWVDPKTTSVTTPTRSVSSGAISQTYTDPLMGTMMHVKGGTFTMGCKDGRDTECDTDEKPAHTVRVSDFYIGETEVTQKQWRAVMGNNPSSFKDCDDCPVEQVSWNDIQDFLSKLNARSGSGRYRLPSEAEWEYAARGGALSRGYGYAGSNDADRVAWYDKNSGKKTRPVKGKDPNELRLYDMSGNVWEWCADCWHDTYEGHPTDGSVWMSVSCDGRVLRGGSWSNVNSFVRMSNRVYSNPAGWINNSGFRLARTAP